MSDLVRSRQPADEIRNRTSSDVVRRIAGYSKVDWLRFQVKSVYRITYAKAKALVAEYDGSFVSWTKVSTHRQKALLDETNHELLSDGLPVIVEEVLNWRMTKIDIARIVEKEHDHTSTAAQDVTPVPTDTTCGAGSSSTHESHEHHHTLPSIYHLLGDLPERNPRS
ncbi:hypothetical protein LTR49_027026 [Elasticomyces elasticus]|nr:hypothetical protein LTR49_027026 [Elasticomyces elasticus]